MVATTVVSAGSGSGFVIDAGAKILAQDVSPLDPRTRRDRRLPGRRDHAAQRPPRRRRPAAGAARPAIGSVVWVVPNHVCPVVNLVDSFVVAQGGRVVDRWLVDARGRNG